MTRSIIAIQSKWKHIRPPQLEYGGNTEHITYHKSRISRFIMAAVTMSTANLTH